uniref:RING-type domain-containing protein n=1 Tax=Setaria digitata TaxID=48799 RepID=A0A915PJU4_9BILA
MPRWFCAVNIATSDLKIQNFGTLTMSLRPQCLICLELLLLTESAALHCGHVFHLHCILQWIELRDALSDLQKEKETAAKTRNEFNACMDENLLLKGKVANLEALSRVSNQQIKHLEGMLAKQLDMEKELQKYRERLHATSFYKLLNNVKEDPVFEIDKYIAKDGLEVKKFITLLRRQLRNVMKMVDNQKEDLQESRQKISELQKELREYRNLNITSKSALPSTPAEFSQAVMDIERGEVVALSPEQRSFVPFDKDKTPPASVMASASKSSSRNTIVGKMQGTASVQKETRMLAFTNEATSFMEEAVKNVSRGNAENDMEEVFVPPIIRQCATTVFNGALRKTVTLKNNQKMKKKNCSSIHLHRNILCVSRCCDLKDDTITID